METRPEMHREREKPRFAAIFSTPPVLAQHCIQYGVREEFHSASADLKMHNAFAARWLK